MVGNAKARRSALLLMLSLVGACATEPGDDGSDLPVPYDQLHGGIVFATSRIAGSAGYDLFWIPYPDVRAPGVLPFVQLTSALGNEWQPSVAANGLSIAYVKDFDIHLITSSGRIRKITDNSGTDFKDSLPALSADGTFIAWVREDFSKPIQTEGGVDTAFVQTYVMMAKADGTEIRQVSPREGFVQDAPAFDPGRDKTRIAWSEFNVRTVSPSLGPQDYGVRIYDYETGTETFACRSENGITPGQAMLRPRQFRYRCFGQHLVWPREDVLVLPQDMLEMYLTQGTLNSNWTAIVDAIQQQQSGIPQIGGRGDGFFPAFPLSASFANGNSQIVFDGVMAEIDGDLPTLSMFVADSASGAPTRIQVAGWSADLDTANTAGFLFSVATPQFIPFPIQ